jgi:hypothetical protein
VKKTKDENLLAGSTDEAPAGTPSLPVMKHGEETPAMLLALLNNVLMSMIDSQQAQILGTGRLEKGQCTIVVFYGTVPTANNLLALVAATEKP